MCSTFYPGELFLENASCYRVMALHTRRSVCVLPNLVLPGKPRARARAKVVISCSTFSNADHGYCWYFLFTCLSSSSAFIIRSLSSHNPPILTVVLLVFCNFLVSFSGFSFYPFHPDLNYSANYTSLSSNLFS